MKAIKLTCPMTRRSSLLIMVAALGLLLTPGLLRAEKAPYSKIVAFGDSLSDTHRYFAATSQPPAPYYLGRHSNGALWIEQLAGLLGMELQPADNYAFAGATTGRDNENDNDFPEPQNFPGLLDQIDQFLVASAGTGVDPEALYVIWAGANDFVLMVETGGSPGPTIANGVANLAQAVATLSQAGARHIMVINVPDIGLKPLAGASGNAAGLSYLVSLYNQNLDLVLNQLALAGIPTIRLRSDLVLQDMVANPAVYGFTNVTTPYLFVGGDANQFLFWDPLHTTVAGHKVLAEAARVALLDYYQPASSNAHGKGVSHSLNGLVNAAQKQ
jgi:thermolabile hemolysin